MRRDASVRGHRQEHGCPIRGDICVRSVSDTTKRTQMTSLMSYAYQMVELSSSERRMQLPTRPSQFVGHRGGRPADLVHLLVVGLQTVGRAAASTCDLESVLDTLTVWNALVRRSLEQLSSVQIAIDTATISHSPCALVLHS